MTAVWLILLIPLIGIGVMALIGHTRVAGWVNVALSAVTFAISVWLALIVYADGPLLSASRMLYIDAFNVYLVTLTAFVGLTTAIFSRPYMQHEVETRQIGNEPHAAVSLHVPGLHVRHAGWRSPPTTSASCGWRWRARRWPPCCWSRCTARRKRWRRPGNTSCSAASASPRRCSAPCCCFSPRNAWRRPATMRCCGTCCTAPPSQLEPTVLTLAFVFLLVGYGTKVGLVPLHNWLPDAHSEGPTPMSAMLSGLLLNVALYALVRVKMLVDGSLRTATWRAIS